MSATRIPLEQIEIMFSEMRANTDWEIDDDMLWGYFFFDRDATKLQRLAQRLVDAGYSVVSIEPADDGSCNHLHVEKVETHTPYSLHAFNAELYALADEFGVESYDGPTGKQ